MLIKDLEQKINEKIKEKKIDTEYNALYKCVDEVKTIVSDIIFDDYIKGKGFYISEYKNNIVIKCYETKKELVIKLKKTRSKEEYKLGWSYWGYHYVVKAVEIADDEFKTLEDFIKCNNEIVANREEKNSNLKTEFEKDLKEHNMNFKEFYEIMGKYNRLNWDTRHNMEKENGLYKGWL